VYASHKGDVVAALAGVVDVKPLPEAPETPATGFSLQPVMPSLKRFAAVLRVDVDISSPWSMTPPKMAAMRASIKAVVSDVVGVDQLEMRFLSMFVLVGTEKIRVLLEVRSRSAGASQAHVAELRGAAVATATDIEVALRQAFEEAGWSNTINSVVMPAASINTVFDGTVVPSPTPTEPGGGGLGTGAVLGIVAAVIFCVAAAAYARFRYTGPSAARHTPPADAPESVVVSDGGGASKESLARMPGAGGQHYQVLFPYDMDSVYRAAAFAPHGRTLGAASRV
jgi:hypothetical protein